MVDLLTRTMTLAIIRTTFLGLLWAGCSGQAVYAGEGTKVAHVYVALCDNANQGIVPVPQALGNGRDPRNNLYWGAMYGVKSFLKRSDKWELKATIKKPSSPVLERCVFVSGDGEAFLIADAYDGAKIGQAVVDFLKAASGRRLDSVSFNDTVIRVGGRSDLVAYVGHNGLMDVRLQDYPEAADTVHRDAIILACASKPYFRDAIREAGANPLLWTTDLMAPEAYTLQAAIDARFGGANGEEVRTAAAKAYDRYQKCGLRAARRLLVTGGASPKQRK